MRKRVGNKDKGERIKEKGKIVERARSYFIPSPLYFILIDRHPLTQMVLTCE